MAHQKLFYLAIAVRAPDEDELMIVKLCSERVGSRGGSGAHARVGSGQ